MIQKLSYSKIKLFVLSFFVFLFLSISQVEAGTTYTTNWYTQAQYSSIAPTLTTTCADSSGCSTIGTCWNSASTGSTDCGVACFGGDAWTKYDARGCWRTGLDFFGNETCESVFEVSANTCSTADKYNSGNPPVMNAGFCSCTVGGAYKTCCRGTTQVGANHYPVDLTAPDEADCSGATVVYCGGGGGQPACGQAACNTLAPPPTATPAPTAPPTPPPPPQSCAPFTQGPVCDTGFCSDGSVCALGHKYCLWDGSGYGSCSEEVNNCATQCAAPPPPPSSNCTFSGCNTDGCAWDQRYVSGDCYSNSWFLGNGCYHDDSCGGGGGSDPSSVSCTATSPVMLGSATTISVTQNPAHVGGWDGDACFYPQIDAKVFKGGNPNPIGSCAATGFGDSSRTRSCTYTPSSAGTYSVVVDYGGHEDWVPYGTDCWATCTNPDGSWCGSECAPDHGCKDAPSQGTCTFNTISLTPCPGGTNACGSSSYQGLSGCNGYWSWPNNNDWNNWCSYTAGSSRSVCYSCNAWGSAPPLSPSSCARSVAGSTTNTANFFWSAITGANPYVSSSSPVYGYYNLAYGTACNPQTLSGCTGINNIYSTSKSVTGLAFGQYAWAVQGCNVATGTCSGWTNPAGSLNCNLDAWIQTSGDIHSNTGISATGGP